MMRLKSAFTIIELLIALFLSSFIMLGMMQAYRNASSSLAVCRSRMAISRKVCLLFNELERDFSSMIIPHLSSEIVPEKEMNEKDDGVDKKGQPPEQKQEEKPKDDAKKSEQKKEEPLKFALVAQIYEDETSRVGGKKFELFKNINFITTHPLQVYGDKRIRLVRVMYELVRDKKKSKPDRPCYNLYRKETLDLKNSKMKENEDAPVKNQFTAIRTYLVTDNVKKMHVELITEKIVQDKEKQKDKEKKEIEEVRLFVWGEKDFTVGVVPKALEVTLELWDDELKKTQKFHIFVPVFSYPTVQPQVSKDEIKAPGPDQKKAPQAADQPKSGTMVTGVDQTSPTTFQSIGAGV